MAPRPTLLRATRTNMTAHASIAVADAAVASSGSKAFWLEVQRRFGWRLKGPKALRPSRLHASHALDWSARIGFQCLESTSHSSPVRAYRGAYRGNCESCLGAPGTLTGSYWGRSVSCLGTLRNPGMAVGMIMPMGNTKKTARKKNATCKNCNAKKSATQKRNAT